MAKFQTISAEGNRWEVMNPSTFWEALHIAWMLWRHPDKVGVLFQRKAQP